MSVHIIHNSMLLSVSKLTVKPQTPKKRSWCDNPFADSCLNSAYIALVPEWNSINQTDLTLNPYWCAYYRPFKCWCNFLHRINIKLYSLTQKMFAPSETIPNSRVILNFHLELTVSWKQETKNTSFLCRSHSLFWPHHPTPTSSVGEFVVMLPSHLLLTDN